MLQIRKTSELIIRSNKRDPVKNLEYQIMSQARNPTYIVDDNPEKPMWQIVKEQAQAEELRAYKQRNQFPRYYGPTGPSCTYVVKN